MFLSIFCLETVRRSVKSRRWLNDFLQRFPGQTRLLCEEHRHHEVLQEERIYAVLLACLPTSADRYWRPSRTAAIAIGNSESAACFIR